MCVRVCVYSSQGRSDQEKEEEEDGCCIHVGFILQKTLFNGKNTNLEFFPVLVRFRLGVVRLEADLQYPVAEGVPVKGLDGNDGFVVVGHRDEAEALALVRLQVLDYLDALDRSERAEQLPEDIFLRLRGQVVDEDAPAGTVDGVGRENRSTEVTGQR